jgi:GNAT superfamily N-acetyltransferase
MGQPTRQAGRDGSLIIQVRRGREADLPHLPDIERAAAEAFRGLDVPFHLISQPGPAETWRPAVDAGTLWVADDAGPVAFLAATRDGDRLHIDEFDVLPERQGRGLGRRMLLEVVEWARAEGLTSVTLTTFAGVAWNAPFYASCGFQTLGEAAPAVLRRILEAEASKGLPDRVAMELRL